MSPPAALLGAVEGLYLDLHRLAFLALVGSTALRRCLTSGSVRGLIGLCSRAGVLLGRDRRHFLVARERRDFVDGRVIDQAGNGQF